MHVYAYGVMLRLWNSMCRLELQVEKSTESVMNYAGIVDTDL